jgi:hypothetical protein
MQKLLLTSTDENPRSELPGSGPIIRPLALALVIWSIQVPASQITYGTDYPYFGLGQFQNLEEIGLSVAELEAIGSGNVARLIPRLQN